MFTANAMNSPETGANGIDLLARYPTQLVSGDATPKHARMWGFSQTDIFRLSHFNFKTGQDLKIEVGVSDVGIGHCTDGAVWAVVIPRERGKLTSIATDRQEDISSIWLRFHPAEISRIFPQETVFADGATDLLLDMRRIANHKIRSSWQSGGRAMIPDTNQMTVDVDTKEGPRRFFVVDSQAQTVDYVRAFENQAVKPLPPITPDAARAAFDQLWEAFDSTYAMFVLRTNVDWAKSREEYQPRALASKSTLEFAATCAEMLRPLRDLHVWLTVAGDPVPIYNRPRAANANPSADGAILGGISFAGDSVAWTVTQDKIGYIVIYAWDGPQVPDSCQKVLEQMRDTRGLIVDVRLNGGGSEDQVRKFASRFVSGKFVYAYSQFRNGPSHTNLTEKYPREIEPGGPWRYDRPVIVLIGQKCMSSNESFIGMMTGNTNALTMGDHTCGSSGNPKIVDLPLEMTVSVPQWIDYLPDGKTPVDEHGFLPQIPFKASPGAFEGKRDDLLVAALERLRQAPLPDKAIAGPAFVSDK